MKYSKIRADTWVSKSMRKGIIKIFSVALLLILGVTYLYTPGTSDLEYWVIWANNSDKYGLVEGYSKNNLDYPPLTSVILYFSVQISKPFDLNTFKSIKISIFIFLLIACFIFWLYTKSFFFTAILYISLFLNSVMHAYVNIYTAPSLILAFWALDKQRITLFAVAITITSLIKWQVLIITPFIAVYFFNIESINKWKNINFKSLFKQILIPASLVLISVGLIFNFYEIYKAFNKALENKYLSGLALNLNWMYTYILHILNPNQFSELTNDPWSMCIRTGELNITLLPRIIFILVYSTLLLKFLTVEKKFENLILYSVLGYLAYFLFNIGVHENHLFLTVIMSILLLWLDAKHLTLAVVVIFLFNVNLWIFNGFEGSTLGLNRGIWPVSFVLSFLNLVLFITLINKYIYQSNFLVKLKNSLLRRKL